MADNNKKVVFHALERLDLVDLRAVQDLAHNAISSYIGSTVTLKSGLNNAWASVSFDTVNHRINFADFTALGRLANEPDNNTSYSPAYLLKFDASDSANSYCSYDSVRALTQVYYNSNNALPNTPTDANFSISTHGEYYPYIFCRPVVDTGESEVRRFWSLPNAQETSKSVNTRTVSSVEFTLSPLSTPPTNTGEYNWIMVGQINGWSVSNNVVSISSVREYHLSDNLFNLDDYRTIKEESQSAGFLDGVDRSLVFLQERIQKLLDGGTQDAGAATNFKNYQAPRLSLSGLDYEFTNRVQKVEDRSISGSWVINSVIDAGNSTDNVNALSTATTNPFNLTAQRDYAFLNSSYLGGNALGFPIAVNDYTNTLQKLAKAVYSVFIGVPPAYTGWYYNINITPLAFLDYSQHMSGSSSIVASDSFTLLTTQWHILKDNYTNSIEDAQKITSGHNALDSTGNAINTTGIRLIGSSAYTGESVSTVHLSSYSSPVPLSVFFKLDLTLINPLTYGSL